MVRPPEPPEPPPGKSPGKPPKAVALVDAGLHGDASLIALAAGDAGVTSVRATPVDARRRARLLYWQGWSLTQICEELLLPVSTVGSWKSRDKWDDVASVERVEANLDARLCQLINKEKKSGHDFKEIDLLMRQFEKIERLRKFKNGGKAVDLNPKLAAQHGPEANAKRAKGKNLLDRETAAQLEADFHLHNFAHQRTWWAAAAERTRFLLKSRQIGATWYFAREALIWGLKTGNNQIFLSASRNQANIFRAYITEWVQQVTGITLKGNPLVIQRGADADGNALPPFEMHFLGTNFRTAQGYHGDVYFDEAFWVYGFEQLFKVGSAMATHSRYRRTIFSTPSVLAHEAHPMWSGEKFNRRRAKADRVRIDTSHAALKDGVRGADRIWRQIVTIDDAIAQGFDLVDIEELRFENSVDEFNLLFLCQFLDDSQSVFPFEMMRACGVDAFAEWRDFNAYTFRPFGEGEVWLGYDPNGASGTGDDAGLVVAAPPDKPGGAFRLLERKRFRGLDYQEQADAIRALTRKYNVTHIAIDANGIGDAVYQLVTKFFPTAVAIKYSVEVKSMMVQKAKKVIRDGRLKFPAEWQDMISSFMAIHPKVTRGGESITYVASRAGNTGHADLAFAVMHILFNEALDPMADAGNSTMEIFG